MAEVEGRDDLSEELPGLFGRQPAFLHQIIKQFSTRHVLQDQVPGRQRRFLFHLLFQRIINIMVLVDFNDSVSGVKLGSDILTGICYFHRHRAASEHEGALLV